MQTPTANFFMRGALLLICVFISSGASAMAFFGGAKTCVFSEVNGVLLHEGKVLKNTKVTRRWEWKKPKLDETTTDDEGRFHFPAVYESSATRLLPVEVVIGQQLSAELNGEENIFFSNGKRSGDENSEFGGAEFKVRCDLSDEEVLIERYGSPMLTKCTLEK